MIIKKRFKDRNFLYEDYKVVIVIVNDIRKPSIENSAIQVKGRIKRFLKRGLSHRQKISLINLSKILNFSKIRLSHR